VSILLKVEASTKGTVLFDTKEAFDTNCKCEISVNTSSGKRMIFLKKITKVELRYLMSPEQMHKQHKVKIRTYKNKISPSLTLS